MKGKPLLLNGKPFDPVFISPSRQTISDYLDKHPGEVFTKEVLHPNIPAGLNALAQFSHDPKYAPYVYRSGKAYVYGTPSAITEYRALIESARTRES